MVTYRLMMMYADPRELALLMELSSLNQVPSAAVVPFEAAEDTAAILTASGLIKAVEENVVHFATLTRYSNSPSSNDDYVASWCNLDQPAGKALIEKEGEPDELEEAKQGIFFFRT